MSDDHPIRIIYPDYLPPHKSQLGETLMKLALDGELEDNEASLKGENNMESQPPKGEDLHEQEPMHRADGREQPFHDRDSVFRESVETRRGILDREFAHFKTQQGNEAAVMAANFAHVRSGEFESHSALLQPKTKTGSLQERVRKIMDKDFG